MREEVIPSKETHPRKFVGQFVRFDLRRAGGVVTEEKGEVIAQEWLGLTKRGSIPEYQLTIRGKSGRSVLARLTDDHVQPLN
jgi:hypothetical protein